MSPDLVNNAGKKSRYITMFTVLDSTDVFKGLARETCAPDSRAHCRKYSLLEGLQGFKDSLRKCVTNTVDINSSIYIPNLENLDKMLIFLFLKI